MAKDVVLENRAHERQAYALRGLQGGHRAAAELERRPLLWSSSESAVREGRDGVSENHAPTRDFRVFCMMGVAFVADEAVIASNEWTRLRFRMSCGFLTVIDELKGCIDKGQDDQLRSDPDATSRARCWIVSDDLLQVGMHSAERLQVVAMCNTC